MKRLLLIMAALGTITIGLGQDFNQIYTSPSEKTIGIRNFTSRWGCRVSGETLTISAGNYNFANDYIHLLPYDSLSYSVTSWEYEENGVRKTGEGAPLNISIKGWSKKGEIKLGNEMAIGELNGYYNGIEFKTWPVKNTTIRGLQLTFVNYGASIEGHDAADGIDTYILTGNTHNLPNKMIKDLKQLINSTDEIRLDIRRMHNPKSLNLADMINYCDRTRRTIHIVGWHIYNEYLGKYTSIVYEDDFEPAVAVVEEPKFMEDGVEFHNDEAFIADSVEYTRVLSVNADSTKCMSTIILPFNVEAAYLTSIDAIPYTVTSVTETTIKTRKIYGTIEANTPFVIKRTGDPKNTILSIKVYDVEIPETPEDLQNGYLVGTYTLCNVPVDCKVVQEAVFKYVVEEYPIELKPFRAYVLPSLDFNNSMNKAPSAISGIEEEEPINEFFDLLGQKATNPVKGRIYINNGKKILIR